MENADFRARQLANQFDFGTAVRFPVRMEYFMEPDGWLVQNVRVPPRIPGIICLCLARDKTPIDGPHFIFLGQRQDCVKCASRAARHIFRANDRAVHLLQKIHFGFEIFRPVVVVKSNHVGIVQLDALRPAHWLSSLEVDIPNSAGQRL